MSDNILDFVKMYSQRDSHIRARAAEKKSEQWGGGYKNPDITNNTTFTTEAAPAETVPGYHDPAPMDLSAVKQKKNTPKE
jgi:hypothetical protein